jgi:hypothetical protein
MTKYPDNMVERVSKAIKIGTPWLVEGISRSTYFARNPRKEKK